MPAIEQVTDSATSTNTKVVGDTPAMAMGNLAESASPPKSDNNEENIENQSENDKAEGKS